MNLWLWLALAFIVQEPVSTDVIMLSAYQAHYNIWLIHALFAGATLFDVAIGYWIGRHLHVWARRSKRRFMQYLVRRGDEIAASIGVHGKRLSLLFFAPNLFPLSALVTPWFGVTFFESVLYLFIGDAVIWYGSAWLLVLGVNTIIPNPTLAIFLVGVLSLLIAYGGSYVRRKWAQF